MSTVTSSRVASVAPSPLGVLRVRRDRLGGRRRRCWSTATQTRAHRPASIESIIGPSSSGISWDTTHGHQHQGRSKRQLCNRLFAWPECQQQARSGLEQPNSLECHASYCVQTMLRDWTVPQVQALDSTRVVQCATVMPVTVRGDRRRGVPAGRQGRPSGRTSTASPPSQSCHRARSHEANHERPTDPHLHRNSPHLRWGLPRLHQQMRARCVVGGADAPYTSFAMHVRTVQLAILRLRMRTACTETYNTAPCACACRRCQPQPIRYSPALSGTGIPLLSARSARRCAAEHL